MGTIEKNVGLISALCCMTSGCFAVFCIFEVLYVIFGCMAWDRCSEKRMRY